MEDEDKILEQVKKTAEVAEKINKSLGEKADKVEFEKVQANLKAIETGKLSVEDFNKKAAEINESMAKLTKMLEEAQAEVSMLKDAGKKTGRRSLGKAVIDALKEKGVPERLANGQRLNVDVKGINILKSVADMGTGNVTAVGSNSIPFSLSDPETGLTRIQRRSPWILQIANTSPTDKMYVQWAEQANPDGSVGGGTAEGGTKDQLDFDWVEKSQKVENYAAFIKTSKASLQDLDGLQNEIDTELAEQVLLKVDADLLAGDGNTPNLEGILSQDTSYDAGSFAATIVDPNNADVLRTAIAQIVAGQFVPNFALLHPTDVAKMDLIKDSNGTYTLPPFRSADGMIVSGVRVLENTGQTVDKFTVGDFTKLNVRMREEFNIDIGYDGNDFTKNMLTVRGEVRLAAYIKTNHAGAFVSGDFSDAIAALATS